MMWTGTFVINTPEAATEYKKMMFGGGAFPFDYAKMSRALHPKDWDPQNSFAPIDLETYFGLLQKKPAGYELAADYTAALDKTGIDAVAKSYTARMRNDPFAKVRKLCSGEGGQDLTVY
jgi:ribose transport system substrate-binding protein